MALAVPLLLSAGTFLTSATGVAATIGAGVALDAFGQYQEGQAQSQAARYQQRVAKNNAALASQNAEQELFRAQINQQRQDWDAQREIADIVSSQAGTGLSTASGSKFALIKSLSDVSRIDAANIRNEGNVAADNLKQQRGAFLQEANMYASEASNAKAAAGLGILKSFVGGAQSYNQARVTGLIT